MRIRNLLVICMVVAFGTAGCGSSDGGDDGVASAGGSPSGAASSTTPGPASGNQDRGLKFAQCMRANGLPDFPDPVVNETGDFALNLPEGVDKAKSDAAMAKCRQFLPNGGEPQKQDPQRVEKLRQLAKCMRDHGVPGYPDPGADGGIKIDADKLGVDPQGPKFKAAQKACDKVGPAPSGDPSLETHG